MAHKKLWGEMIDGRGTVAGGRTRLAMTTESESVGAHLELLQGRGEKLRNQ